MENKLKAAILIVSDTASEDPASDKVVNALAPILAAEGKWEPPAFKIVPDDVLQIQESVRNWTDGPDWYNLILLSGGTGFAIKDNTPEVCILLQWYMISSMLMTSLGSDSPDTTPCSGPSVSRV
jgi:gephyrin